MRKLVLVGMFAAFGAAAPAALACGGHGQQVQEVILIAPPPPSAATQQSQALLADATRLDGKADTEEAASATVLVTARMQRRKAVTIRMQAGQASEASQVVLLAKADKLDAEAAMNDASSATFLARAKIIRARAKALRALSTRVLASGALTTQVLPRVMLPAPPAGHPDSMALRALDAAPRVAMPVRVIASI